MINRDLRYSGFIGWAAETVDVEFCVKIDESGVAAFEFGEIPYDQGARGLKDVWLGSGSSIRHFELYGIAEDGSECGSVSLDITGLSRTWNSEAASLQISARCSRFIIQKTARVQKSPFLRVRLRSFENFPDLIGACEFGKVSAVGQSGTSNQNLLGGYIAVRPETRPDNLYLWKKGARDFCDRLRGLLSFASGRRLTSPITEYYVDDRVTIEVISHSLSNYGRLEVIHKLNQQPFFDAAISYISRDQVDKIKFALSWFSMEAEYNETLLINAMTAIENLVESNLTAKEKKFGSKNEFDKVKSAFREALRGEFCDKTEDELSSLIEQYNERISDVNRISMKKKISRLSVKWGIYLGDISALIDSTIRSRNDIIHKGTYLYGSDDDEELWRHVTVARELVARFVLTAIGYRGRYISWVGGHHDADFPPGPISS
ncbi:MAG: hypothetical protein HQL40_06075 [Alphaproteobacteria bacterium]|nr:hypothetical protein [Alphaproteobacteria bacterium]